jgi:hypothetical protein
VAVTPVEADRVDAVLEDAATASRVLGDASLRSAASDDVLVPQKERSEIWSVASLTQARAALST